MQGNVSSARRFLDFEMIPDGGDSHLLKPRERRWRRVGIAKMPLVPSATLKECGDCGKCNDGLILREIDAFNTLFP